MTEDLNVQEWTVNGPVPKKCHNCEKDASYWAGNAVWLCVEHWDEYFEACKKVTPPVPTTRPSSAKEVEPKPRP